MLGAADEVHGQQAAVAGGVNAVVVVRRQVNGGLAAAVKQFRPAIASQQFRQGIADVFRLHYRAVINFAPDGAAAVHGANEAGLQRPQLFYKWAGEEIIEALVI